MRELTIGGFIERLQGYDPATPCCGTFWLADDFLALDATLTGDEIAEVMQRADDRHDAGIEGVRRAEARVVRAFDPAFVVQKDIADHKGNVFARKGQRVSPFDVLPTFNQTLVFIVGR